MALGIEVLSVENILPSSPTPHLTTFHLSQWDLVAPPMAYSTFIYFYASDSHTIQNTDSLSSFLNKSRLLKQSLSKTLVHYYPLAGRLINDSTAIDCNDQGAPFVEARCAVNLLRFLSNPDAISLRNFMPEVDVSSESRVVMVVQLTLFDCGGTVVSVHISHRLVDAASMFTFVRSWMSVIHGHEKILKPVFLEPSSSPPGYLPAPQEGMISMREFVSKRFVFPKSKIEALKMEEVKKIGSEMMKQLSDVDIVMAIIMKSAISASRIVSGVWRPTFLFQLANMRKRVSPPFPENSIGNIYTIIPTVFEVEEIDLSDLISKMRKCKTKFQKKERFEATEWKRCKEIHGSSSLCNFPVYSTDFGWGKPLWAVCTPTFYINQTILMDTREGDGIEAWVSLDEKQMPIFQRQKEILTFGSVNPSVLLNYSRL